MADRESREGPGAKPAGLAIMIVAALLFPAAPANAQAPAPAAAAQDAAVEWTRLVAQVEEALRAGQFDRGVELGVRALALAESAFPADDPRRFTSMNDLSVLYVAQSSYAQAEPLAVRALEGRERVLGREHPDTLEAVNNLGVVYTVQGRFDEAEPLLQRAVEARERVLGRDHVDTLESLGELSLLYQEQGRYSEAETLEIRVLAARERVLGREHSDTLTSTNNLALIYYNQGRYSEAEPLYLRALEARERLLGRDHPDTVLLINNLAVLYDVVGRLAEAEPLYVRALETRERVLGREHLDTLSAVNNLAFMRQVEGRYAEAEPLYLRALEAAERTMGREHPETLIFVNNLAFLYGIQGRYADAETLYLRSLEARDRTLGRDHPDTLISVHNLAALYHAQSRFTEAEPLFLRTREAHERTQGAEHPRTLIAIANLARLYEAQGRFAEAEPLMRRALEANERVLGRDHSDTLKFAQNLARLHARQGRFVDAEPLYLRVLEARERLYGRDHPDTAAVAAGLASLRLSSPPNAISAIGPARLAVASYRARRLAAGRGAFAEAQRGREESQAADHFSILADAAWSAAASGGEAGTSLTGESFAALQDATAGTTNRAVIRMAVRRIADETGAGLGALVREREELNEQWASNNSRYSSALGRSGPEAEAQRLALPVERQRIEARMDEIDAVLRRDFPQYFALIRPEALDIAATQALLGPDEAILMVVPTSRGTHVMAVSRTGIQWVRSQWTANEVTQAVARLHGDIRATMEGTRFSYDRRTAHALYRQLVAPVSGVLRGKRHVFVVAAGSLTSLPFGILVTAEPQGADDDPEALRATPWLADAHALIGIPSVQSLQFLRRFGAGSRPAADPSTSFLGFGDPALQGRAVERGRSARNVTLASVFSGRQTRSGAALAEVGQLRLLNRLPGTAVELESMRAALGAPAASLFLAERSTERALRSADLSDARIIVLATHGLVAGEIAGAAEPGLVFTPPAAASEEDDGFLTASEVTSLHLDADWVILSACNTAAGDGSEGAPGLSGLARAFFYAGARNLLASHWLVADDAAPRLTVRTIELMRENPRLSRAEALQGAMREVRNDPGNAAWAHPGVWAPFSLIGDGAR